MKFSLAIFIFFLFSCAPKIVPVKGEYAKLPVTFKSEKSFDQVWDNLIDFFAQTGLSIKLIDKNSGLLVSDKSAITATWEDRKGKIKHPEAFVVVPTIIDQTADELIPITISYAKKSQLKKPVIVQGEWNVRIKKVGTASIINVNLVNLQYTKLILGEGYKTFPLYEIKSTGNFEKKIADLIR